MQRHHTLLIGFLLCALLTSNTLCADNAAALDKIESANAAYSSQTCSFTQQKTTVTGAKNDANGTLYYVSPDKLSQHYVQPATDLLVINGANFYMARNDKKMLFDTSKNQMMRNLSNTLLYCIQGKIRQLATENDANVDVSESADNYIVTLTARKKAARGYKTIVLHYAKKTCLLTTMRMDEMNGASTLYQLTDTQVNSTIDASKFIIPKK